MSRRDLETAAPTELPADPTPAPAPRCLFLAGRGGTGKTLLLRWMAERAVAAGRTVVIADGDRTNRSLPHYFDDVLSPPATDEAAVARWLEQVIATLVEDGHTRLIDLGGGDQVLKHLALELDLQGMLEEHGVAPTILHLIGPETESLGYLSVLEKPNPALPDRKLFAPARTALILNEGLLADANADPAELFEPIRSHRIFGDTVARGAKPVIMPRLAPALEINRRYLSFTAAAQGKTKDPMPPLGITDRQRVKLWLRAMEQAFAPIADWLP